MIRRTRLARAVASIVLASGLLLATAGCVFITPTATLDRYDPSDGISGDVGTLGLRNVLAISNEDGSAASLLLAVVNNGTNRQLLNVQYESGGAPTTISVVIDPRQTTLFGNTVEDEQIILVDTGAAAGELVPVYFQYGNNEGTQLLVPVLEASFEYAELGPRV